MNELEIKAWQEALAYAFDKADLKKWSKKNNYKNYAIQSNGKLYPNKIIYSYAMEFLKENYSETYLNESKIDPGVGVLMNFYLAERGAEAIVLDNLEISVSNFKKLLEYFVSHLDWVVNEEVQFIGFKDYIKPLIDSESFKRTGQGYAGGKIQNQIRDWGNYDSGEIAINIQPNFGDYKTVKCYLNWKGTGVNIVTRWEGNSIISIYQDEYLYLENPPKRVNLGVQFTLQELGLFDEQESNDNLISFYKLFVQNHENYKSRFTVNEVMNNVLESKNILEYKKQIILQGPPGTGKTREAKLIAEEILNSDDLNNSEQFKLVQFHPSYTYEDFVRGIVAESKGDKIEYKNVNKILGEFAERAVKNFKASSTNTPESNLDVWIEEKFEDFKNNIEAKLPEEETILSGDISVFEVNNDHFKYGKKWQTPGYLKFGEFKKLVKAVLQKEIEPSVASSKLNKEKFIHAHYRFTYYNALLTKFFNENIYEEPKEKIDLKNYVLIIDEINRANLSSVLGELIYALEYRGESVDSMYAIGEDNKLMLPPNLYIIGTMNTADRSVGHIDYAMRRRFAFVDVLPKDLSGTDKVVFDADLFAEVSSLFVKDFDLARDYSKEKIERAATLSSEFEPKDVWLGHSYFIQQYEKDIDGEDDRHKPYDFNLRVEYEIKPILREYHKDGILIGDGIAEKIEALAARI